MSKGAAYELSKHVVGFSWVDYPIDKTDGIPPRLFCLTCFVVSLGEHWFLATAGHCMEEFDKLVASGKRRIELVSLYDEIMKKTKGGIPLLEGTDPNWCFMVEDINGIDCGYMHLPDYYVRLLKTSGIEPIDVHDFAPTIDDTFDHYGLIGFPSETINPTFARDVVSSPVSLAFLPLAKAHDVKSDSNYKVQFNIVAAGTVNDIDGISGGPIFGFTKMNDGRIDYKVVGVQCGWFRESKRVFCTPTAQCGPFLFSILEKFGISLDQINRH